MARSYRRRRRYRRPRATLRRRRRTRRRRVARRQFRRAHAGGQIYYKVKRLIPVVVNGTLANGAFWRIWGNLNGCPTESGPTAPLLVYRGSTANETVGMIPANLTGYTCGDVPNLENQMDQVRIAGMKVKWLPGLPAGVTGTGSYFPAVTIRDRDGIDQDIVGTNLSGWMEQLNGVGIWNMYRPYKTYVRATKYRMNTNVPAIYGASWVTDAEAAVPVTDTPPLVYPPARYYGGQWHRVTEGVRSVVTTTTGGTQVFPIRRSQHWSIQMVIPSDYSGEDEEVQLGVIVVTSYLVYKDRR